MKKFQIIQKEYVPELNLEVFGNMLNKRETLHNQAIKANSELKNTIANLNLNEAEEGFRKQLISDIETTLEANKNLGDYAGSYDDMIKISGDIVSNPALISKLKAQQDYQTYIKQLEARTDLPQHYKDYYRNQNKYYEGEYDENGNWVKGTKWEPTKLAAQNIDKNTIINQALRLINPKKGSYSKTTWIDVNGKMHDKYVEGANMVRYNTVTGTYETVKAEDVRKAIDAVLAQNSMYEESLRQDYEIAKYDLYNDKENALYDVNNGTNGHITFEQFKDNLFNPIAKSYAYSNSTSSNNFNSQYGKQLEAMRLQLNLNDNMNSDLFTNKGEKALYYNDMYLLNYANNKKAYQELTEKLNQFDFLPVGFSRNIDLINSSEFYNSLQKLLENGSITTEQQAEVRKAYNIIRGKYINDIHHVRQYQDEQLGTRQGDALQFRGDLTLGQLKPESEQTPYYKRLIKEWNAIEQGIFGKDGEGIEIQFANSDVLEKFEKSLTTYGIRDLVNINNNIAYIDRSNNNRIIDISAAYLNAMKEGYKNKPLRKAWNLLRGEFSNQGDNIYRINQNGERTNLNRFTFSGTFNRTFANDRALNASRNTFGKIMSVIPGVGQLMTGANYGMDYDARDVFFPIQNFYDRIYTQGEQVPTTNIPIDNLSYNAGTPDGVLADMKVRRGVYEDFPERNNLEKQQKDSKIALFNQVKNSSLHGLQIKMKDKNGVMTPIHNLDDITKINEILLKTNPDGEVNYGVIELDRTTGRYVAKLNFVDKKSDNKYDTYTIYVDDVEGNYLSDLNNDPRLIAYRMLDESKITGRDLFIGAFGSQPIFSLPINNGTAFKVTNSSGDENFNVVNTDSDILENVILANEIFKQNADIEINRNSPLLPIVRDYIINIGALLNIDINNKNNGLEILKGLRSYYAINLSDELIDEIWEQ